MNRTTLLGLAILMGCGGDPFVAAGARVEALALPDAGEAEASAPDVSAPDALPPSQEAALVDSGPTADVDAGQVDEASVVDAPVDSAPPPWQLACFGDGGVPTSAEAGVTTSCQPMGSNWSPCAGCAGTFGYTCWDGLPPAPDCSRSGQSYCCAENVCTRAYDPTKCQGGMTPYQWVCAAGVAPPTGCTQESSAGGLTEYCCPG